MALKGKSTVTLIGKNAELSKSKKMCYLFVDGEKDKNTGLFLNSTALTFWTEKEIVDVKFGQLFEITFEVVGENIVIRDAVPLKTAQVCNSGQQRTVRYFLLGKKIMYKTVRKRMPGYFREVTRTILICDGCGRRITYSSSSQFDKHFCEKCFKKQKGQELNVSTSD